MESILILHGWGGSSKSWQKVKSNLESKGHKVFCPDLPGFGQEKSPSVAWDVSDYVNWVLSFIQKQNLGEFFLLGHSFGGRIAIKLSALHSGKTKGLILVDPAGINREKNWNIRQRILVKIKNIFYFFMALPGLRFFFRLFRKVIYRFAGVKDYYRIKDEVMKETFKKVIAEDLLNYVSCIKDKTLIVWGRKDKLVPVSTAFVLKENIPISTLEIIENIGHNPHLECPDKLSDIIIKFLA